MTPPDSEPYPLPGVHEDRTPGFALYEAAMLTAFDEAADDLGWEDGSRVELRVRMRRNFRYLTGQVRDAR